MNKFPIALSCLILLLLCACVSKTIDYNLPKEAPTVKKTDYSDALRKLGRMTRVFNSPKIKIQTVGVVDDTGAAQATGGEIPYDITEMIKSAVNSIGGSVVFIPYDPHYLSNMYKLKYTTLQNKVKPDILISGGITEFDRSLVATGDSYDFGGEFGMGSNAPSGDLNFQDRNSISSVTLDLNLVDIESMAMVPRMQAVNSVRVYKGARDTEIGFSILGVTFGVKGSVKKIQGRHAAVRTLVELSILEVVGKYLGLPYWKCLDAGSAKPDPVVLETIKDRYYFASKQEKISMVQNLLRIYGYPVRQNGVLDKTTVSALKDCKAKYTISGNKLDEKFYEQLFINAPAITGRAAGPAAVEIKSGKNTEQSSAASRPERPATTVATSTVEVQKHVQASSGTGKKLKVDVWTDKREYTEGDNIVINIKGNTDFFAKVVYETASGDLVQLLPNMYRQVSYFKGGRVYSIPDTGDKFEMEIAPPFGNEKIIVYASQQPLGGVKLKGTESGMGVFKGQKQELDARVRGIKVGSKTGSNTATTVVESSWSINTVR